MIYTKKASKNLYSVFFKSKNLEDKYLGSFIRCEDGFFLYFPGREGGGWSDYVLISIGEKLLKLNKPWTNKINKEFSKSKKNLKRN